MDDIITTTADIPASPYYVTCTDKFMSGWGPCRGRNNRLVFVCRTQAEAWIVYDNAMDRPDQKNVRMCSSKPALNHHRNMYQIKTRDSMPCWYQANYFNG